MHEPPTARQANPAIATGKPGWQTTEFWFALLLAAAALAEGVNGILPAQVGTALAVIVGAIYKATRVYLKVKAGQQAVQELAIERSAESLTPAITPISSTSATASEVTR